MSLGTVCEIRDSGANDVTRFNAAAFLLNKVIPDKIQIDKRSIEIQMTAKDLTKLMEMAQTMQVVDKPEE